jgi:hypothetical protein
MAKKSVAKKDEAGTALAVSDEMLADMAADAGGGFEGTSSEDYAIPFMAVLQKGSPQVDKDDDKYVEGAEPGMIMNNVTLELFEEITVIPCARSREFVEWIDRDSGGGMAGRYSPDDPVVANAIRDGMEMTHRESGNSLMDTRYHYCLLLNKDGGAEPVVVSMSSTSIKVSRNWMTRMRNYLVAHPNGGQFNPPMFAQIWKLGVARHQNDSGTWYTFAPDGSAVLVTDTALYAQAKQFGVMAKEQELNLSNESAGGGSTGDGSEPGATEPDDEIPF